MVITISLLPPPNLKVDTTDTRPVSVYSTICPPLFARARNVYVRVRAMLLLPARFISTISAARVLFAKDLSTTSLRRVDMSRPPSSINSVMS